MNLPKLDELLSSFKGEVLHNEPLKRHCYYRIGGPAKLLLTPRSIEDLAKIAQIKAHLQCPIVFLGKGSNILFSDEGFEGLVVKTSKIDEIFKIHGDVLEVGASVPISVLLKKCSEQGWGGLEFLTGVPGSVGGVVVMNAGTHLGETASRLLNVESCLIGSDGRLVHHVWKSDELRYSYRTNHFLRPDEIVLKVKWKVDLRSPIEVQKLIQDTLKRRKETQPIDYPSCGSVFMNPAPGQHAWQIIEKLGLRGHRIGDAQFSDKHCNFIINHGNARAADVRELIRLAKSRAKSELGIELHEEVRIL